MKYDLQPGEKRPSAGVASGHFRHSLKNSCGDKVGEVLAHACYGLHFATSRA